MPIDLELYDTDLIDTESLMGLQSCDPAYVEERRVKRAIADGIVAAVGTEYDFLNHAGVAQGLFESGVIDHTDDDFGFMSLLKDIVGAKMLHAVPAFLELFDGLVAGGYTNKKQTYNSSGDNYFTAYSFDTTKVIVVENQSPMFAYVLVESYGLPDVMHIIRMRQTYKQPKRLNELLKMKFDFSEYNYKWSSSRNQPSKLIATLSFRDKECVDGWFAPMNVIHSLFNIYSGRDSLAYENKIDV